MHGISLTLHIHILYKCQYTGLIYKVKDSGQGCKVIYTTMELSHMTSQTPSSWASCNMRIQNVEEAHWLRGILKQFQTHRVRVQVVLHTMRTCT